MAVYTDFFLASDESLRKALPLRVPRSPEPPWRPSVPFSKEALKAEFPTDKEYKALKRLDFYEQKNLMPDLLESLHLMLGGSSEEFYATLNRPPLIVPGENPFGGVFQLSPQFVRLLSEIEETRITILAEEWLGDKKVKPAVVGLRKLAKKAVAEGLNMYLLITF